MKTLAETTTVVAATTAETTSDLERKERESRSLALEKAYVHDVYDQLSHHFSEERYRPWPRVRQFLEQLEPGSLVCDAGCGNGKYLQVNPSIFKVGSDRCAASVDVARRKDHEVLICDALNLPYRDESFDAALSIAVIHHLATRDRRVRALRELARILRVGGRILITVWAKEQRHRKFESQDILVPWRTPDRSSSEEKAEVGGNEHESIATTTTTSDEDVTHYHAYSQTSESDSCYSCSKVHQHHSRCPSDCSGCLAVAGTSSAAVEDGELPPRRRHHRPHHHHKGRSFDPHRPSCSSQSSSDLSSPSDSCYSFVRKALQKLASTRRAVGNGHQRRSWFTLGESIEHQHGAWSCAALEATDPSNELPIELRHLDSEEDGVLGSAAGSTQTNERISRSSPPSLGGKGDSSIFFGSEPPAVTEHHQNNAADSSSSISPILPRRSSSSSLAAGGVSSSSSTGTQQPSQQSHGSRSLSLSDLLHSLPVSVSSWLRHRLSEEDASSSLISPGSELDRPIASYSPPPPLDQDQIRRSVRPMLTKQKRVVQIFESYCEEEDDPQVPVAPSGDSIRQSSLSLPKAQQPRVFKQGSMNDSLLSAERLKELETLKQSLLPRQVTWSGAPSSYPLVVPESSPSPPSPPSPPPPPPPPPQPSITPSVKQTAVIRPSPSPLPPPAPSSEIGEALKDFSSLRNGFVRIWQTLRGDSSSSSSSSSSSKTHLLLDDQNCDKPWLLDSPTGSEIHHPARSLPQRRPPSLLEKRIKSFCGWGIAEESATGSMSPSPRRLPPVAGSEEDFFNFSLPRCCADQDLTFSRSVHPHRLSCQREEGSDSSSKDSSLQSDTSVDSEDSCVSVIYVPRPGDHKGELEGSGLMVDPSVAKTRNNSSSSSDGSPKVKVFPTLLSFATELTDHVSPASVKSPGMTTAQQEGQQMTNSPKRQSCLRQPNVLAASNETVDKDLARSVVPHFQQQARPVHQLLSFEVFNPETDDMDSDSDCGDNSSTTSESSSSNSAGSVISVGDPMWPAFQDRRQTILSGSSLDFQTSASCDLASSEQADNSLIKQDSNDSWPASIEDPSAQLTTSSQTSRNNQSSPVSLVATGIQESQESKSSPSPSLGESSTGGSSAKQQQLQQQQQNETHSDVEEWRVRSSLGPLDECHEEESAELGDAFQYNKSLQQQQQTQQPAGVQQQQQWKLDKVKGSFSASTSSLDSSISAPSYSSARQSSSASAISTASEMRKSSDDSTGFMSTLPLLRSRVTNCAAASSTTAASASSTTGFHQIPSATGSGGTGIRTSGNKPINCGDDEFCSKPLNKMLLGGCGGDQRSADRDSSLSISTSQDSLPSDAGGSNIGSGGGGGNSGTVTLHRYYHVFRQGELDQLIERYVDSLHIISSYYDHANHCVVAEKVHVWTI